MFSVYDNEKPAVVNSASKDWKKYQYDTFEAAKKYALNYLGVYAGAAENIQVNDVIDYSGYGDTIEIRESK